MNMRDFVKHLIKEGRILRIKKRVSPRFEISSLMKKLDGKPLLFENIEGHEYRIIANIYSSRELVAEALGIDKNEIVKKLLNATENPKKPPISDTNQYIEIGSDITKIPIPTYYPKDGGPYITSGIVAINDNEFGLNASYHRMMVIDNDRVVMRILPRHFHEYIKRGNREFAICIGNPIQVAIAAAISCEIDKSEFDIANSIKQTRLYNLDGFVVPDAEIIIIARMTDETHDEGPFLDLTETFDIVRKQPVARIKKIFVKEKPMFHALLPGGMEHKILMGMPREPTIFMEVNKVCQCKDVLITPGGCSWLHAAVSIKKKHNEDGKRAIEAAFKGHKSMKHVFVVDDDIDIHNPLDIEWAMATRFQGDRDIVLKPREKGSSLDPSSNQKTRETCKIGFDLTIPDLSRREEFTRPDIPKELKPEDYIGE